MALTVNPLDPVIDQITENAAYLTQEHKEKLAKLLQSYLQANEEYTDERNPKQSFRHQIARQFQLLERMQNDAMNSANVDFADHKAVLAASKALMDMLKKFREEMERESREKILEDAIKDAFVELADDTLRVKFMNILRTKLSKNAIQKAT